MKMLQKLRLHLRRRNYAAVCCCFSTYILGIFFLPQYAFAEGQHSSEFHLNFKGLEGRSLLGDDKDDLMKIVERPDEELLIASLSLGNLSLRDDLLMYETSESGDFFVALQDILLALEIPIDINMKEGAASGWINSEQNTFKLDLKSSAVTLKDKVLTIGSDQVELHDDGIYVTLEALESWFPLTGEFDYNNLKLSLKTLQPFPVEIKIARDSSRDKLSNSHQKKEVEHLLADVPDPFFSLPYAHVNSQMSFDNSDSAQNTILMANTAQFSGIAFGQDTKLTVNETVGDSQSPEVRLMMGRRDPQRGLTKLGLSEYRVGDVNTSAVPFVARSNSGRGVAFTNRDVGSFGGSLSNTVTLRGELPVGYQADIVKDGQLIGFVERPDENGEYVFDVGVMTGLNVFEIVFYGPQGQKETKEERIFVPVNPVKKGDFRYNFGAMQDDVFLFHPRTTSIDESAGMTRALAEFEYGMSETLSMYGAVANVPVGGDHQAYGLMRYGYSFKGIRSDLSFVKSEDSGRGIGFGLQGLHKGMRWQAEHRLLYDFVSEETLHDGLSGHQRHHSQVALSGLLPFIHSAPFSFNLERLQTQEGITKTEWRARVTNNVKKLRITSEVAQTLQTNLSSNTDLGFQVSSRYKDVNLRGALSYGVQPARYLKNVQMTADWRFKENMTLRGGLRYSGGSDPEKSVTAGLSRDYDKMKVGVNLSYNDRHEFLGVLSTSFSVGVNPVTRKPYMTKNDITDSAVFVPHVFYDKNGNAVFDGEDEWLKDVSFTGKGVDKKVKTDEQGYAYVMTRAFERSNIVVDSASLSDPYLRSRGEVQDYILRPNQTVVKDIPIVMTGEIDSQVYTFSRGFKIDAKAIGVQIVDATGNIIETGKSEYDGFVSIGNIPLGQYDMRLDGEQLKSLGYCPAAQKSFLIDLENPAVTVEDFTLWSYGHDGNKNVILSENLKQDEVLVKWGDIQGYIEEIFYEPQEMPAAYLVSSSENSEQFALILHDVEGAVAEKICQSLADLGNSCRVEETKALCPEQVEEVAQLEKTSLDKEGEPEQDMDLTPDMMKDLKQGDVEKLLKPLGVGHE